MPAQGRNLAKFMPPTLKGVARERLFRILDKHRAASVIWVCGPSGAGKTTLVANYLQHKKRAISWVQLDRGDRDAPTFFYYLSMSSSARKRQVLPLLTPEYLPDVAKFAHRFFREFFALLPPKGAVVLDNWQEIDDVTLLQETLRCACEEVPQGNQLFVLSRYEPPIALARLRAQGKVAVLGWQEMRLTIQESAVIASALRPNLADATIDELHRRANGWLTGLRLLLDGAGPEGIENLDTNGETAVFNYFAGELYRRCSSDERSLWLKTALVPRFSAKLARELSGNAHAQDLLEDLSRRHFFIEKRGVDSDYEYHSLFKGFLIKQATRELNDAEFSSLQRRSASLLLRQGQLEDATNLFLNAQAWDDATQLILQQASTLIERGRGGTLRDWILRLPTFRVDTNPRLLYAIGAAQIPIDARGARRYLERSHKCFVTEGNDVGQALAIAGVLEANYYEYASYIGIEVWIDDLVRILEPGLTFPTPDAELMTNAWLLIAMTIRTPSHEFLPFCAERVVALIERGSEVNCNVIAGALLLNHYDYLADDKAQYVSALIKPHLGSTSLTPFNKVWWLLTEAQHCAQVMDYVRLQETVTEVQHVIEINGLRTTIMLDQYIVFWTKTANGQVTQASSLAPRLQALLNPKRRQEQLLFVWLAGVVELLRDNPARARSYADEYTKIAVETGSDCLLVWGFSLAALAYCMAGDFDEANRLLVSARAQQTRWHGERIDLLLHTIDTYVCLSAGDENGAEKAIKQSFRIGRKNNHLHLMPWIPAVMSRVCEFALASGIETDYATRLIRARQLTPSSSSLEPWPWPVRIRSLGQFQVFVNDAPLTSSRKAPKKPLDLLKLLVALGGEGVSSQVICDTLWPESEGDAAPKALSMALYRLRNLLGNDAAISLHEGKLSLNREICWIDIWVMRELSQSHSHGSVDLISTLLTLYRGEFASSESEHPWLIKARERWQALYVQSVVRVAETAENQNDWASAVESYRQALEPAPTAQELHRRLILCYLELGHRTEAAEAHSRCRAILRERGITPDLRLEGLRARAELAM